MDDRPTIIDEDAEHIRASYWRRRIMLLKPEQLAQAIGWSVRQIYQMESGIAQKGEPIDEAVWHRYKMACTGVHAVKYGWTRGRLFDWRL